MSNGLATVASGLVGLAAMGALAAARARRGRPYLADGLLVAVDGPADPVATAVRAGFAGVEVAVRLDHDTRPPVLRLDCVMPAGEPAPTFEAAVLEPLATLVDESPLGRVHPRRAEPFLLLVHADPGVAAPRPGQPPHQRSVNGTAALQAARPEYEALDLLLRPRAEMLTTFLGGRVVPGAITVVLTGPYWSRADLLGAYERFAFLEGRFADLEPGGLPVTVAPLVTEALGARLGWDPQEEWPEFPAEARHILRSLVGAAHAGGRRIRFVDVPEGPRAARTAFWQELRAAGVDLIASHHRGPLARFLRKPANRVRKHRAEARRSAVPDEQQLNER
ncbi:hypothetical protein OHA72_04430 [Dactylosporangium sp. NBC_01737]|uniref:hypothetical protein n=1 Tax=Dactylosporangium sp. NBC_01737 TaxID=2975959 RepID=UPI002E115833|nr:hypothetical protein OHA72_04430 [Dactylosporangium sp. NBC_01737]